MYSANVAAYLGDGDATVTHTVPAVADQTTTIPTYTATHYCRWALYM